MVKRATIQVSSRTKKESSRKWRNWGNNKRQQKQHLQYFTTKLPLQEWNSQVCPREAVVLVVYLAEGLYTREACFVLAKRCSSL